MRYLTLTEILVIHDRIIESIGGSFGVREENLLRSIVERPKTSFGGTYMFPEIFDKAATYLESLATYHVFVDGNKRTAIAVTSFFLSLNGFTIELPIEETESFILAAAQKHVHLKEIALWLKKHCRET